MRRFTTISMQNNIGKKCDDYYVNAWDILEELKPYEVNMVKLCKTYNVEITEELKKSNKESYWIDINTELRCLLEDEGILEEVKVDNTYNYNGKINHDIAFIIYHNKKDDMYYVDLSIHLMGDIRGNYTDSVIYKFEYETEIYDFLLDCYKTFSINYKGIEYKIRVNCLSEIVEVFGGKYGELDIINSYDIYKENIKEELQKYIDERNSKLKIGSRVEVYDMLDKEKLSNIYFDKEYYNMTVYTVTQINKYNIVIASFDNPTIKVRIKKSDLFKIFE